MRGRQPIIHAPAHTSAEASIPRSSRWSEDLRTTDSRAGTHQIVGRNLPEDCPWLWFSADLWVSPQSTLSLSKRAAQSKAACFDTFGQHAFTPVLRLPDVCKGERHPLFCAIPLAVNAPPARRDGATSHVPTVRCPP
jgi:hypothetical protein